MKEKLNKKFILSRSWLFKELFYLRKGDLYVTEYKLKFEEIVFEYDFQIYLLTIYICFITDWDLILKESWSYMSWSLLGRCFLALELELFTFKIRKWCSTCEGYGHHGYDCPSIKCSKCGEFKYYDYQCLSKS